jgi:pilus assembly protein TadC
MLPSAPAVCAGSAAGAAVWLAGHRPAVVRLRRVVGRASEPAGAVVGGPAGWAAGALGVLILLVGLPLLLGPAGAVVAVPAVALVGLRAGRSHATERARSRACDAAVPRVADLLASCVAVGVPPPEALDIVRRAVGGPIATRLAPVVSALQLGGDPVSAYLRALPAAPRRRGRRDGDDPTLALVQALGRAAARGTPLAEAAGRVADESRRRRRWSAEAAARRAGVLAVGPLMVCHLPAFVLIGVVPLVLGVARSALGDLG